MQRFWIDFEWIIACILSNSLDMAFLHNERLDRGFWLRITILKLADKLL